MNNLHKFNEAKKNKIPNLDEIREKCIQFTRNGTIRGTWVLNEDGSVDIDGDVILVDYAKIPLKFGRVTGKFDVSNMPIKSLVNSPTWLGGNFDCSGCLNLKNLIGSPTEVGGDFFCYYSGLTSLEGSPRRVGGGMVLYETYIRDFKGGPDEINGDIDAWGCEIVILEGLPENFDGYLNLSGNRLSTLHGLPKFVRSLNVADNKLTKINGCPFVMGSFDCCGNKLKTLKGGPKRVSGSMDCSGNSLTNLKGAPEEVGESFICYSNNLTSWEGVPKRIGEDLVSYDNPDLYDPKFYPETVQDLDVTDCPIDEVYDVFCHDTEDFLNSMHYNYLRDQKIIKFKLEEACYEFDLEVPTYIFGYEIVESLKTKNKKK